MPRGDVFDPPLRQLPVRRIPIAGDEPGGGGGPGWFFVAAHGGAGVTLLARLSHHSADSTTAKTSPATGAAATVPDEVAETDTVRECPGYGLSAGRAWPDPSLEPTGAVVVVCQSTMRGLGLARDVAAQYLSGHAPSGIDLVGLVVIADQPGRLPPPLAAARGLLGGVYRHVWTVPYVADYRLLTGLPDEACPPIHPGVADALTAIRTATTAVPSEGLHA